MHKRKQGDQFELLAWSWLENHGYSLIDKNFARRIGEIDLIVRDPDNSTVVFVEVRFRKNKYFGDGAATVTTHKQSKLIRAAMYFLSRNKIYAQKLCRFDVISISINQNKPKFNWIKSAFEAPPG